MCFFFLLPIRFVTFFCANKVLHQLYSKGMYHIHLNKFCKWYMYIFVVVGRKANFGFSFFFFGLYIYSACIGVTNGTVFISLSKHYVEIPYYCVYALWKSLKNENKKSPHHPLCTIAHSFDSIHLFHSAYGNWSVFFSSFGWFIHRLNTWSKRLREGQT